MHAQLQRVRTHLFCPSCNAPSGYQINFPEAVCVACHAQKDIFNLLNEAFNKSHADSDLWTFAFSALSTFNLAPVYEGYTDQQIFYKPFQGFTLDLNEMGISKNSKILYINFTPEGGHENFVMPVTFNKQNARSIDEIPHKIFIIGMPWQLKDKEFSPDKYGKDLSGIDTTQFHKSSIFLRWCDSNIDIEKEHLLKAAEGYWKNDIPHMVYNAFTAIELQISKLIQRYWVEKKGLSESDYDDLFNREPISKKLDSHLLIMAREASFPYLEKDKITLLKTLRLQRNECVHRGKLRNDLESSKAKLYAITCWTLLALQEIEKKLFPTLK